MSVNICPGCGTAIDADAINITEGVALCPDCGRLSRLSEVVDRRRPIGEILENRPRGCTLTQHGHEIVAKVRHSSLGGFLTLLGITAFWNGITGVFVLIAFAGIYSNLFGPLPDWFPAPPMDDAMGLGMSIFLCLFLIPFVVVGLGLFAATLLALVGKTEVVIGEYEAYVSTGVFMFRWRRHFNPQQVHQVELVPSGRNQNGNASGYKIAIRADEDIEFAQSLPDARRDWLYAVLHELLINPDPQRRQELLLKNTGGWHQFDEA